MAEATQNMGLKNDASARFGQPAWTGDDSRGNVERPRKQPHKRDRGRGGGGGGGGSPIAPTDAVAISVRPTTFADLR